MEEFIRKIIRCPFCVSELHVEKDDLVCEKCGSVYPLTENGISDLRLKQPKKITVEMEAGNEEIGSEVFQLYSSPSVPDVFNDVKIPRHLNREFLNLMPMAEGKGAVALDIGSGDSQNREICGLAGYQYIAMDYWGNDKAAMFGDAQALPFWDHSVDLILSVSVLEHVRNPMLMAKEMCRVLKKGGRVLGTSAFMQPFHGNSFYHCSHLGLYHTLAVGGLMPVLISPIKEYPALYSLSKMALFPGIPPIFSKLIVLPVQALHLLFWKLAGFVKKRNYEKNRRFSTAGSFLFLAEKQ